MLVGTDKFHNGVTTVPRVNPAQVPMVLKKADGYFVDSTALVPAGGIAKASQDALALQTAPKSPSVFKVGSDTWLVTNDSNGKVRYIKTNLSKQSWSAAVTALEGLPQSRMCRYNEQVIIPTADGMKRFEPDAVAAGSLAKTVDLSIPAPAAAPSVAGSYPQHESTLLMDFEEGDGALYASYGAGPNLWGHRLVDSQSPSGGAFLRMGTIDGWAESVYIAARDLGYNYDFTEATHFSMWVGDDSFDGMGIRICVYSDSGCTTKVLDVELDGTVDTTKTITVNGRTWYTYTVPIADASTLGTVRVVRFEWPGTTGVGYGYCDIDNFWIHTNSNVTIAQWGEEDTSVQYRYCYAGPSCREGNEVWVISPPSDACESTLARQNSKLTVTVNTGTVRNTCDVTHILVYRRTANQAQWYYVQSIDITEVADSTAVTWDDLGGTLDGDTVTYLPNLLEFDHDPAPKAKYVLQADQRLYAANCDYSKTAVQVSARNKPWYWVTTTDSSSSEDVGSILDGYQFNGSEVRALALWQSQKVVLLDNEFFLLYGDSWASWHFTYVDSVGCASDRSVADCRSALIWHSGDGFYKFNGSSAQRIDKLKVDASLVDFTKVHDAVYWNDKYVFYCYYNGAYSLLIYDLTADSWVVRTCPQLAGICADRANGRLYGINAWGWAVRLFSGTQDWGNNEYANHAYDVWSCAWPIGPETNDFALAEAVFDIEASQTQSLTVTVYTKGKKNATVVRTLTLATGRNRYRVRLHGRGHAVEIRLQYTGQYPPTIYAMRLESDEEPVI
jgi:hypothetical protein